MLIIQTGKAETSDKSRLWKNVNPGFEYQYYNDKQALEFLQNHFSSFPAVMQAFKDFIPGAFRADLFRYAVVYIEGGFYMDLDIIPFNITQWAIEGFRSNSDLIAVRDRDTPDGAGPFGIWQGAFGAKKHSKFIINAIQKITEHVRAHFYGCRSLSVTGPILFGEILKESIDFQESKFPPKGTFLSPNGFQITFLDKTSTMATNKGGEQSIRCDHYDFLWNMNRIFHSQTVFSRTATFFHKLYNCPEKVKNTIKLSIKSLWWDC